MSEPVATDTHNPIRVGLIGLGRSGWSIHAKAYQSIPELYKVVAVTDRIEQRRQDAAAELNAVACDTVDDLLAREDVEMVVVASQNKDHAPQVIRALNAGKHVLCEKPFGLTTADADAMIAASQQGRRVLQPFQQRRYEEDFQKVKQVCESGLLGRIEFIRICWHGFKRRWDWQTVKATGGGTMNNNGPHLVDHAMELFGDGEPEVWSDMRRCLCSGDAEDHLKIILRGKDKPTIEIELTDIVAYNQDRWLVCGTNGGLRGNADHLEWKWVDWSTLPDRPLSLEPTPDRSYNFEKLPWQTDSWKPAAVADTGGGAAPASAPVLAMYRDLYRSIREGAPQVVTPQSVRRRVAVMEKARRVSGFYAEIR
jgi:predicted dehydrogenase